LYCFGEFLDPRTNVLLTAEEMTEIGQQMKVQTYVALASPLLIRFLNIDSLVHGR
jgi:hypothetical protein